MDFAAMKTAGRYTLLAGLDRGGMATVYLGKEIGAGTPIVACKVLHPHLSSEEEFRARFLDEARLVSRIDHPNVVGMLEVIDEGGELVLVMPYIFGVSLAELSRAASRRGARAPWPVASSLVCGVLSGLHAAHEARTEDGTPLRIVHRDVSPRNVVVGVDGMARLLDFGIARAAVRSVPMTTTGNVRGTPAYMAPEQARGEALTRRTDVFMAGILLWELSTGRRLNAHCTHEAQFLLQLIQGMLPRARTWAPNLPPALEAVIERAMELAAPDRFETAEAMEHALRAAVPPASTDEVAAWMADIAAEELGKRSKLVAHVEGLARGESLAEGAPPPLESPARGDVVTETAADVPSSRWHESAAPTKKTPRAEPPRVHLDTTDSAVTALYRRSEAPAATTPDAGWNVPEDRRTSEVGVRPTANAPRRARAVIAVAIGSAAAVTAFALALTRVAPGPSAQSGLAALGAERASIDVPASVSAAIPPAPPSSVAAAPSTPPPPSVRPTSARPSPAAPPPSVLTAATRPSPSRCSPPTYLDARGILRIKDGCSGR